MKLRILLVVMILLLVALPISYRFLVGERDSFNHRQMLSYLVDDFNSEDDNKGKILFIGSSSIYRWSNLKEGLTPLPVLQRGYGFGRLEDLNNHLWLTTLRYKPKSIVLFAGVNDLTSLPRVEPEDVLLSFSQFARSVHKSLPETCVFFIAMSPSPAWNAYLDKIRKANKLIQKYAVNHSYIEFIPTEADFMDSSDNIDNTLFASDRVHLSEQGYKIWNRLVKMALTTSSCLNKLE